MWGPVLFLLDFGKKATKQLAKGRRQILNDAMLLGAPRLRLRRVMVIFHQIHQIHRAVPARVRMMLINNKRLDQ